MGAARALHQRHRPLPGAALEHRPELIDQQRPLGPVGAEGAGGGADVGQREGGDRLGLFLDLLDVRLPQHHRARGQRRWKRDRPPLAVGGEYAPPRLPGDDLQRAQAAVELALGRALLQRRNMVRETLTQVRVAAALAPQLGDRLKALALRGAQQHRQRQRPVAGGLQRLRDQAEVHAQHPRVVTGVGVGAGLHRRDQAGRRPRRDPGTRSGSSDPTPRRTGQRARTAGRSRPRSRADRAPAPRRPWDRAPAARCLARRGPAPPTSAAPTSSSRPPSRRRRTRAGPRRAGSARAHHPSSAARAPQRASRARGPARPVSRSKPAPHHPTGAAATPSGARAQTSATPRPPPAPRPDSRERRPPPPAPRPPLPRRRSRPPARAPRPPAPGPATPTRTRCTRCAG